MNRLTDREQEILKILQKDPMIAQEELAEKLRISRSAAAVHISSLIKKGFILGRGYVFNEGIGVAVIGPVYQEVTVQRTADKSATGMETGLVTVDSGGMADKFCSRLSKLKTGTSCFTVVGKDPEGEYIIGDLRAGGVDVHYIAVTRELPTSRIVRFKDMQGRTVQTVGDIRTTDLLTGEMLRERETALIKARMLVLDTLTTPTGQRYILELAKNNKIPICVFHNSGDPEWMSYDGVLSLLGIDRQLAEKITGIVVRDPDDACKVAKQLVQRGIRAVLINFAEQGVAFATAEDADIIPPIPGSVSTSFDDYILIAGVLHGILQGYSYRQAVRFGIRTATLDMSSESKNSRTGKEC